MASQSLNAYAAEQRRQIFADLSGGRLPQQGIFDEALIREARSKGAPRMGTTLFHPHEIVFEFIYPDPNSAAAIVRVSLTPPERIVFMPVPKWVVENVWQGEVDGSPHFESDAQRLLEEFAQLLDSSVNEAQFAERSPTGKA